MARVFISHSSRDKEPAKRIMAWLCEQGFETPFLDFDKHGGIPPGADWEKTLYREIERCEAIVIIQTPNWLDSKWCFVEYTQGRALGKAIFPVIETPTGETLIAPDIQALDLLQDREGGLERLSQELTRIALDAQGGFPWDSSRPPYPGLHAFQEEDAALYFGRDDDIRHLIERLNARRAQGGVKLIALLGASGSGKSSLLRAGVIPRIKRDRRNWIVLPPMRPQAHPVDELARVIAVALKQGADWRSWRDQLMGPEAARALGDLASDLRIQADANEAQILISIDQAEELFGAAETDEANRFFEILNLAMSENLPYLAVMAQRSDYLEKLQSAEKLTARFEEFSLPPLPVVRIPQIIEGPARVAGLVIEEGLVLQAAKDAETEDALPLLAFALRELYDRYGDDNHLSLDEYHALGNPQDGLTPLENAVRKAADDVLADAKPSAEELAAVREAFVPAMVRVNDRGEYVRQPARWDELPAKAHPLLERLARARLLVISQAGEARMVEVAHEALLRKWPRLRSWLDDAREFLTGKQQLESDLHDWERASEADKTSTLLTGLKLNRARGWLLERPHQLTEQERALIQASIEYAEAEERRQQLEQERKLRDAEAIAEANKKTAQRTKIGLFVASILLVLAGGAGIYAMKQADIAEEAQRTAEGQAEIARQAQERAEDQAEIAQQAEIKARVRELSTKAVIAGQLPSPSSGFLDTALLLAQQAISQDNGPETQGGLRHLLLTNPLLRILYGHKRKLRDVSVAISAGLIASASLDKTVRIWKVGTGEAVGPPVEFLDFVNSVALCSKRDVVAAGLGNGKIAVWRTDQPQAITHLGGKDGHRERKGVMALDFSPECDRLASSSKDERVLVWDMASMTKIADLKGHKGQVVGVAFSPDGERVVSGSYDRSIRVWNVGTEKQEKEKLEAHKGLVNDVAWSSDNIIASGGADRLVKLWDLKATTLEQRGDPLRGHDASVLGIAFSPDGSRVATACRDKTIRIWDVETRSLIGKPLRGHGDEVWEAAFTDNRGKQLVSVSSDQRVILWDLRRPSALTQEFEVKGLPQLYRIAFHLDGKKLATSGQGGVRVLDIVEGTMTLVDGSSYWGTPSMTEGDRELLTSVNNKKASFAVSANQSWGAEPGGKDGTIKLWTMVSGKPVGEARTLTGHTWTVKALAFNPHDDNELVSASLDGTLVLWDVKEGRAIGHPLQRHVDYVFDVAYRPDGKQLASAGRDGKIILWDIDQKRWKQKASRMVGRNMTQDEWRRHMGDAPYQKTFEEHPNGE